MRNTIRLLSLAVLFLPLTLAQSKKINVTDLLNHPFQADFPSGSRLNIHLRSGDIRITGLPADTAAMFQHLSQMEIYLDPTSLLPVAMTFNTHPDNNALLDIPVIIRFSD